MPEDVQEWAAVMAEAETLGEFNRLLPLARERGDDAIVRMLAAEAKRRGYLANKAAGKYERVPEMQRTKGKNLVRVGWQSDYLYCEFAGGKRYRYAGVSKTTADKLLRSIYPDSLIGRLIAKETGEKL